MRSAAITLATLALVGAAAAPATAAAQDPTQDKPDPTITDGSAQRALDAARARWRRAGSLRNYHFSVEVSCFCAERVRGPHRIVVRGGKPRSAPSLASKVATVPRMFRFIQLAINGKVARLNVTYGARGVPRVIGVDTSRRIADEEIGYSFTGFKRD